MIVIRKDLIQGYIVEHFDNSISKPAECITRPMTAAEWERWGRPKTKVCPGCGRELMMSAFTFEGLRKISKYCRPCFDRRREGERKDG